MITSNEEGWFSGDTTGNEEGWFSGDTTGSEEGWFSGDTTGSEEGWFSGDTTGSEEGMPTVMQLCYLGRVVLARLSDIALHTGTSGRYHAVLQTAD